MQQLSQTEAVDTAIRSRMSVRAFTQQAVARADIEAILEVASRAPSGSGFMRRPSRQERLSVVRSSARTTYCAC